MAVTPTTRSGKGAPLLPSEGDANLTTMAAAINATDAKLGVVLNPDGTLKDGAAGTPGVLADGIVTLAKLKTLEAAERPAVVIVAADGTFNVLKGTEGQMIIYNAAGLPTVASQATLVTALIQANAREWLATGALTRVVDATVDTPTWQALDLAAQITALGAVAPTAVILRAKCYLKWSDNGDDNEVEVRLRVTDNNAVSATSEDVQDCHAYESSEANDRFPAAADATEMTVKLNGTSVYWNARFVEAPAGSYARLWVVGFRKL